MWCLNQTTPLTCCIDLQTEHLLYSTQLIKFIMLTINYYIEYQQQYSSIKFLCFHLCTEINGISKYMFSELIVIL